MRCVSQNLIFMMGGRGGGSFSKKKYVHEMEVICYQNIYFIAEENICLDIFQFSTLCNL
jgi:hypothetical protein